MERPGSGNSSASARELIISGTDCAIPPDQRTLTLPSGEQVFYPRDMWPPIPGQACRPYVLEASGVIVEMTGGLLGAFYPSGLDTPQMQRKIDKRVRERFPHYEP